MGLELIILSLCIGNYACEPATTAYFSYNPVFKEFTQQIEANARRKTYELSGKTGQFIVFNGLVPLAGMVYKREASFSLHGPFGLSIKPDAVSLTYKLGF